MSQRALGLNYSATSVIVVIAITITLLTVFAAGDTISKDEILVTEIIIGGVWLIALAANIYTTKTGMNRAHVIQLVTCALLITVPSLEYSNSHVSRAIVGGVTR